MLLRVLRVSRGFSLSRLPAAEELALLSFVFSLPDAFKNRKASFLGVRNGNGLGGIKGGPHAPDRFLAGRTFGQRLG